MPLAFPSHQGLILPVVRIAPRLWDVRALCVGAAMPDVIDGAAGLYRGDLGQGFGHSLAGVLLLCWPVGLLLTAALAALDARLRRRGGNLLGLRPLCASAGVWAPPAPPGGPKPSGWGVLRTASISLIVGAASHVAFDCVSHERCYWLYPWRPARQCFPSWWYAAWFTVCVPLYREPYPFAPHTVVWCALSVIGAVLFYWPALRGIGGKSPADK
jgi:hypothetical protein